MTDEQQQEQASLYVLGALASTECEVFEQQLRGNAELRQLVRELQTVSGKLALSVPRVSPPTELRGKILDRIQTAQAPTVPAPTLGTVPSGFHFLEASDPRGWKELPIPGASIKLLSLDRQRGFAVLLGKLAPGVRYPAHVNAGPEDICILTGDLHVSDRRLGPGDFHHAEAGTTHEVNYSVEGCTLIAVLTTEDPLVAFAMA